MSQWIIITMAVLFAKQVSQQCQAVCWYAYCLSQPGRMTVKQEDRQSVIPIMMMMLLMLAMQEKTDALGHRDSWELLGDFNPS